MQYTIQSTHTYRPRGLRPKPIYKPLVLDGNSNHICDASGRAIFTPPDEAAAECNVKMIQVCCDTLDDVNKGRKEVVAATAETLGSIRVVFVL